MEFLNWFLNPVRNHYADFEGRTSRKEFWMFMLVYILLSGTVAILAMFINMPQLHMLFAFAVLVPNIAITARRLHDINMSGWWQLISLVPFVGVIILIVLLALPAKDEGNIYGSNTNKGTQDIEKDIPQTDSAMKKAENNNQV